jgi:hypothetical protein
MRRRARRRTLSTTAACAHRRPANAALAHPTHVGYTGRRPLPSIDDLIEAAPPEAASDSREHLVCYGREPGAMCSFSTGRALRRRTRAQLRRPRPYATRTTRRELRMPSLVIWRTLNKLEATEIAETRLRQLRSLGYASLSRSGCASRVLNVRWRLPVSNTNWRSRPYGTAGRVGISGFGSSWMTGAQPGGGDHSYATSSSVPTGHLPASRTNRSDAHVSPRSRALGQRIRRFEAAPARARIVLLLDAKGTKWRGPRTGCPTGRVSFAAPSRRKR